MSKTRSDSKLAPHEDFIFERLVDGNESYQTVVDTLQQTLGVRTSASALSQFFNKNSWRWRAERAASMASSIETALKASDFTEAKAKAIAQREFEIAAGNLSIDDVVKLRNLDLKARAIDQQQAALDLRIRELEQKAAEVRRTLERAKSKGSIDKATIAEIEEKLGML
jgi:hypothetical protein